MNNLWIIISLILLGISSIIFWISLNHIFCESHLDSKPCNNFLSFTPSIIEIAIGIGIALIIHDHTRKIQSRENNDLNLTIQGTYYHLWNLCETLRSYIISDAVRSEHSSSIQILNLLSQSQANLSKCGQKLDLKILKDLQLHLILIQQAVSVSVDPRSNIEEYWKINSDNVKISFENIKVITKSYFEPYVDDKNKMIWKDLP